MNSRGFTLVELMIVVAIIAIIAAIALPSYNRQVEKSRRADAQSALMNAAQTLERCFTRTNTYVGCDDNLPDESPDGFYALNARVLANQYVLQARPQGVQANDACGEFRLNHLGVREADGAATDRCWGS
jgi:type IV pilus assembly protein PilE